MWRGFAQACRTQSTRSAQVCARNANSAPPPETSRPWVGCSHWTTPFRPEARSYTTSSKRDAIQDTEALEDGATVDADPDRLVDDGAANIAEEGVVIDQVEPVAAKPNLNLRLNRPQLPSSIKKLNRLLSHDRSIPIPESDLIERFVKGRGPGGQAINKTNSSVSLTHIPTGIRIQSQPTRSREENRKIARKILAERLDLLRAHEAARANPGLPSTSASASVSVSAGLKEKATGAGPAAPAEEGKVMSRKEQEREMAGVWSREEIRWEKERRRKLNKAKKSKKKHRKSDEEGHAEPDGDGGGAS